MTLLAVIVMVLTITTVIGHVTWILCARLLGFRLLTVPVKAIAAGEVCTHCGRGAISAKSHESIPPPIPFAIRTPTSEASLALSAIEPLVATMPQSLRPGPRPSTSGLPVPPPAPRRSLSSIVSAFMEERNIRWGELVGGLLIVGCSIALVISFWAEISRLPYYRFVAMTAVTTALFGLGLYSEHRWNLPTTSRGILLISTLLTPLNFLACAAFSGSAGPALLVCELLSAVLFAFLLWAAARVIAPQWPGLLTCGTMGLSASLLIIRFLGTSRFLSHAAPLLLLATIPIGCELFICGLALARAHRRRFINAFAAESLFLLLGVLTFATILAVGLIVHDALRWQWALARLAPLIAIGAAPLLAGGAILHRRVTRARFVNLRVAATAVAILGALVMLACVGLGWPNASSMIAAAFVAFLIFSFIASIENLSFLYVAGIPCLALAWVLGFHLLRHDLSWETSSGQMAMALTDSVNGIALLPLLCMFGLASEWMSRRGAKVVACIVSVSIAALGAIGVALVSWRGFGLHGDPRGALWVYLSYGVGCLLLATRENREAFAWAAWLLFAAFLAQLCLTRLHLARPWETALLLFATLALVVDLVAIRAAARRLVFPARALGAAASACAGVILAGNLWPNSPTALLLWLSAIWFVFAVQESSRALLFVAQCTVHLAVTLAYLSEVNTALLVIKARDYVHAAQINSILFTAFAALWHLMGNFDRVRTKRGTLLRGLAHIDLAVGVGLNAIVALPAAVMLALAPNLIGAEFGATVGAGLGWAAVLSASAALLTATWHAPERPRANAIGTIAITCSALIALSAGSITHDEWVAFHTLVVANLLSAWGMALFGFLCSRFSGEPAILPEIVSSGMNAAPDSSAERNEVLSYSRSDKFAQGLLQATTNRWACVFAGIVICLAIRGMAGDALRAMWSVTPVVMVSLLFAAMAAWSLRRIFLFGFGLTLNLAATLWIVANPLNLPSLGVLDLANVNVAVLACAGLATLIVELHLFRPNRKFVADAWPEFHDAAAVGSFIISAITTGAALSGTFQGESIALNSGILVAALASTLACVVGRIWDSKSRLPIVAIYATGLLIAAAIDAQSHFSPRVTIWFGCILISCHTLISAWLWRKRSDLARIVHRFGCDPSNLADVSFLWLLDVNSVLSVLVLGAGTWIVLTFAEFPLRLGAAVAVALQSVALSILAPMQGQKRVRVMTLAMGMFGTLLCAWAAMSLKATVFDRLATVLVIAGGWGFVWSIASSRSLIAPSWAAAVRQNIWLAGAVAGIALATTVACEFEIVLAGGRLMIGNLAMATIAVSFAAACAIAIGAAIRGVAATRELNDAERAGSVYVAELLLAFLFLHLRLARPHWFGRLEPWWPLVVMGIAFAGATIGEILRRKAHEVIAEPIHRTGLFLPLLPTLGFWLVPSRVNLSLLLLTVAILYAMMSLARKSNLHALLAGLMANLALWSELQRIAGTGFFEHPQLWLIPLGLLLLAAGESNRQRLNVENLRKLRYLALSIIYLSSTADIFLNGVERAPWLPLVLAILSIGGVLAGVSFRIRPLLFLGVWFLGIAVLTMIYYASRSLQWTWIWYVAGIALGGLIILIFAVFEKKRTHVLAMVDALKKWK